MIAPHTWRPLKEALERWTGAGLRAPLWLRDDDAVEPSPALDTLTALTGRFRIPVAVAIVPEPSGERLATRLAALTHVTPIVHGWTHRNHAPEGEKKQEFGPHRPASDMQCDLERALHKLKSLYGARLVPMFVPPWNRMAPQLLPLLREIGYVAISTFGQSSSRVTDGVLPEINTHVDLIDFRGTRKCRDHGLLTASLAETLDHSRMHGRYAVGVLSHHLVHDRAAFDFLEALFSMTSGHEWLSPHQLIEWRVGFV